MPPLSRIAAAVGAVAIGGAAIYGLMHFGRFAAKFGEETRRQTFETSRAYRAGTNLAVNQYCLDMTTTTDANQRKALARMILSELATYEGPMTDETAQCANEARRNVEGTAQ